MGALFGTDGIRGEAGKYPITPEMMVRIGRAAGRFFGKKKEDLVVIGHDGRRSADGLEKGLAAGLKSSGIRAGSAGLIPTPGVAFLVRNLKAAAGIVISASHNPYRDNGVKFFNPAGFKLSSSEEAELEKMILAEPDPEDPPREAPPSFLAGARDRYRDFLIETFPSDLTLEGLKLVLDCAHGAASPLAPEVFSRLGAEVTVRAADPDGTNINRDCGSQHPEGAAALVVEERADAGLAFDGDADRLIAVDETGSILTGDQILAILAGAMKKEGRPGRNLAVTTVMSNLGLGEALERLGITHLKTGVGDREVMERMRLEGAVLGGEASGHLILLDYQTTGDGILAALQLLAVMIRTGKPLSLLARIMNVYPQVLINVPVSSKPDLATVPEIRAAVERVKKELGKKGRVLVRYSGTQPLCRVMVEGPTREETEKHCRRIAEVIETILASG